LHNRIFRKMLFQPLRYPLSPGRVAGQCQRQGSGILTILPDRLGCRSPGALSGFRCISEKRLVQGLSCFGARALSFSPARSADLTACLENSRDLLSWPE
jgi:hypothetical protein